MKRADLVDAIAELATEVGTHPFPLAEFNDWVADMMLDVRDELDVGESGVDVLVTDPVDQGDSTFVMIVVPQAEVESIEFWFGVAKRQSLDGFFETADLGDSDAAIAFVRRESSVLFGPYEDEG